MSLSRTQVAAYQTFLSACYDVSRQGLVVELTPTGPRVYQPGPELLEALALADLEAAAPVRELKAAS